MISEQLNRSFCHRWLHFQHLLDILNLRFGTDPEDGNYFSLYSCIHISWFWVGVTIYYALILLRIYFACSCNWSFYYFYWKSCVICSFLENVSLASLKISYRCFFYINQIKWIEPNDLALSLFLIKDIIGGCFRCISKVLFEFTLSQSISVSWYCFFKYFFITR